MTVFLVVSISFILGALGYFISQKIQYGHWYFDEVVEAVCVGVVTMLCTFVAILVFSMIAPTEEVMYKEQEIQALNDTTRLTGQAFLFTSTASDVDYYHYITKTNRGIVKAKTKQTNSYIIEDNNIKPSVKIYRPEHKWKIAKWLYGADGAWGSKVYEFYVPTGTVISNYYDVGVE